MLEPEFPSASSALTWFHFSAALTSTIEVLMTPQIWVATKSICQVDTNLFKWISLNYGLIQPAKSVWWPFWVCTLMCKTFDLYLSIRPHLYPPLISSIYLMHLSLTIICHQWPYLTIIDHHASAVLGNNHHYSWTMNQPSSTQFHLGLTHHLPMPSMPCLKKTRRLGSEVGASGGEAELAAKVTRGAPSMGLFWGWDLPWDFPWGFGS